MKPPRITLRQAGPKDMMGCARVFLRSAADLSRRQGVAPATIRPRDMARALAHLQKTDPRGFHVAVRGRKVVAFASTALRGRTHFLSMFWTLPSLQSRGIGRRLLARAFEKPNPPASAVRCVFASLDPRAQALYLKFGMVPRGMLYVLRGQAKRTPPPKRRVRLVPVGEPGTTSRQMLSIAARFDRIVRAARRDADIRYITTLPGSRFFLVRVRRSTLGYAVITDQGRVGPACVVDARYGAGLAWAILDSARDLGAKNISAIVPGQYSGAFEVFFRAGLRSEFFGVWMSAKPVGSFEAYLLLSGMLL